MDSVNSADRFDQHLSQVLEPLRRYLARRTDPATADDVLGETLLVLWRRAGDIPVGEADAVPWAIGIARFQLANAERAARRQRRLFARIVAVDRPEAAVDAHHERAGDDGGDWHGGGAGRPDDGAVERIRSALAALRPADAEILRLAVWEELTPPQIASVLGITPNAASIRLHRARKRLRAEFERLGKVGGASGHDGVKEGEHA
ncbi:RNA polymerase sigma factor [Herbiconiux ginsengi]|uniref:RNA polymerase sigma-70 factor, ECF subfamily n=1 Tax=Herbiconiux ginsengi TaxID=381665 RepID=A0A1H3QN62_9MICO|nr:sigma-70 family RNA polymerase sigma factor [Herbiconiux ginsengi]SDZ14846.1 RNA polymerase sigma-70 factor, ECF subfamily [Herbiconiux ginsengi]